MNVKTSNEQLTTRCGLFLNFTPFFYNFILFLIHLDFNDLLILLIITSCRNIIGTRRMICNNLLSSPETKVIGYLLRVMEIKYKKDVFSQGVLEIIVYVFEKKKKQLGSLTSSAPQGVRTFKYGPVFFLFNNLFWMEHIIMFIKW